MDAIKSMGGRKWRSEHEYSLAEKWHCPSLTSDRRDGRICGKGGSRIETPALP